MTRIIALTGGIGSGKSAVADRLAERGATRLDADGIVHDLLAKDETTINQVIDLLGESICSNGRIDRKKVSAMVFNNRTLRMDLERVIHPAVRARIARSITQAIDSGTELLVIEVPLLFETGMDQSFPESWLVTADEQLRIARVQARDHSSEAEIRAKMNAQWPDQKKIQLATHVVTNNGTIDELNKQLDILLAKTVQ